MVYIGIKDGKIALHGCGPNLPQGDNGLEMREIKDLTGGAIVGTLVSQINKDGRLYRPEELAKRKILKPGKKEVLVYEGGSYVIKADYTKTDLWNKATGEKVSLKIGRFSYSQP